MNNKYKIGDRVRVVGNTSTEHIGLIATIATIVKTNEHGYRYVVRYDDPSAHDTGYDPYGGELFNERDLEPVPAKPRFFVDRYFYLPPVYSNRRLEVVVRTGDRVSWYRKDGTPTGEPPVNWAEKVFAGSEPGRFVEFPTFEAAVAAAQTSVDGVVTPPAPSRFFVDTAFGPGKGWTAPENNVVAVWTAGRMQWHNLNGTASGAPGSWSAEHVEENLRSGRLFEYPTLAAALQVAKDRAQPAAEIAPPAPTKVWILVDNRDRRPLLGTFTDGERALARARELVGPTGNAYGRGLYVCEATHLVERNDAPPPEPTKTTKL